MDSFPVIIVTGLSGSGKSTALGVFEDMGFFTVDGLPVELAAQMVEMFHSAAPPRYKGLVLGMDLRQSGFAGDYEEALQRMKEKGFAPRILFVEAKPDILMRRYAVTRRPHPLEREGLGLEQALAMERSRLNHLRSSADLVLDTSTYSIHDLRRALQAKWKAVGRMGHSVRVHLISFGFKYGTPSEADMVFDLRFLPNPYFEADLKPLSGKDPAVADYVLGKDPGAEFFVRLNDFLLYLLERYEAEGRFRLTIAVGCTGGRHRSVAVAEALARTFGEKGWSPSLEHRHLELG